LSKIVIDKKNWLVVWRAYRMKIKLDVFGRLGVDDIFVDFCRKAIMNDKELGFC